MKYSPAEVRKFLVAVATVLSQVLALGLIPAPYASYVTLGLGALGALGIFHVPNKAKATQPSQPPAA